MPSAADNLDEAQENKEALLVTLRDLAKEFNGQRVVDFIRLALQRCDTKEDRKGVANCLRKLVTAVSREFEAQLEIADGSAALAYTRRLWLLQHRRAAQWPN